MKPFCKCKGKHKDSNWCSDPKMVIYALKDAQEEMSCSNYHNEKIGIAIKVIKMFCKEHKIPMHFVCKKGKYWK